ncbi:hypothetical protein ANN_09651, partial [Periplaneta americana]
GLLVLLFVILSVGTRGKLLQSGAREIVYNLHIGYIGILKWQSERLLLVEYLNALRTVSKMKKEKQMDQEGESQLLAKSGHTELPRKII